MQRTEDSQRPKPALAPRPVMLEPVAMPEPETPVPSVSEALVETPAVSAPESAASQASAAPAAPGPATASAGAPFVEARFDAAYLHNPKPPYPAASSRLREEGTVRLRVHVLPDGSADQVEIRSGSGFGRLDASARATVLRWRFVPGRRGGETIAFWVIVPIHFNLE